LTVIENHTIINLEVKIFGAEMILGEFFLIIYLDFLIYDFEVYLGGELPTA